MQETHSFRRGLLVAVAVAASAVVTGRLDVTPAYALAGRLIGRPAPGAGYPAALAVMLAVGAFLCALPGRLRRRGEPPMRSTPRSCLIALLCGFVMTLASGLARGDSGAMLLGVMQGNLSAWVFFGCMAAAGFAVSRLTGRWRA